MAGLVPALLHEVTMTGFDKFEQYLKLEIEKADREQERIKTLLGVLHTVKSNYDAIFRKKNHALC
jgi:hypothetical protein